MMGIGDIKIKRVVRTLDLGEYQEEYAGTTVEVWVNPPLKVTEEVMGLIKKWQEASLKRSLLEKPKDDKEDPEEKSGEKAPEERPVPQEIAPKGDAAQSQARNPAPALPSGTGDKTALERPDTAQLEAARTEEDAAKAIYHAWYAQVWEDSSEEEVLTLIEKLEAEEPGLLVFLRNRTLHMIEDYANARKKA